MASRVCTRCGITTIEAVQEMFTNHFNRPPWKCAQEWFQAGVRDIWTPPNHIQLPNCMLEKANCSTHPYTWSDSHGDWSRQLYVQKRMPKTK